MSGVVNQAGSRSGVVGHMADAVMLKRDVASGSPWVCTSVFRPEFKTYEVRFHAMKMAGDDVQLRMQFSIDNGSSWVTGSNYDSQVCATQNGSVGVPINLDDSSYATVGGFGNQGAAGNEGSAGSIWFYDPMNPTARKNGFNQWVIHQYNTEMSVAIGSFSLETSDPQNAFKLYPSSGDFDTSSANYNQVSVWGYR